MKVLLALIAALGMVTGSLSCSSDSQQVEQLERTVASLQTSVVISATSVPDSSPEQGSHQGPFPTFSVDQGHFTVQGRWLRLTGNRVFLDLKINALSEVDGGQVTCCTTVLDNHGAEHDFYGNGADTIRAGGDGKFCLYSNTSLDDSTEITRIVLSWATVDGQAIGAAIELDVPDVSVGTIPESSGEGIQTSDFCNQ